MSTTSNTDFAGPLTIWLEQAITGLLTAPGPITIPKLPGGIIGGPGPIDLFSTRFANTFTADVKAEINGTDYDNAGLKAKLANIKSVFNPETTTFERSVEKDGRSADVSSSCIDQHVVIMASFSLERRSGLVVHLDWKKGGYEPRGYRGRRGLP
jgi:hypothetical protein